MERKITESKLEKTAREVAALISALFILIAGTCGISCIVTFSIRYVSGG